MADPSYFFVISLQIGGGSSHECDFSKNFSAYFLKEENRTNMNFKHSATQKGHHVRVPKTSSARRHCRTESFCASGKFLRVFSKLDIK